MDGASPIRHCEVDQLRHEAPGARRVNEDMIEIVEPAANPFEIAGILFLDVVDREPAHMEFAPQHDSEIARRVNRADVKEVRAAFELGLDQMAQILDVTAGRNDAPISPSAGVARAMIPHRKHRKISEPRKEAVQANAVEARKQERIWNRHDGRDRERHDVDRRRSNRIISRGSQPLHGKMVKGGGSSDPDAAGHAASSAEEALFQ